MAPANPANEQFAGKAHPAGKSPCWSTATGGRRGDKHRRASGGASPGPAPLIPADPAEAAVARMLDRVFDNYVMGNMQPWSAHINRDISPSRPARHARRSGDRRRQGQASQSLSLARGWLGANELPPHVSLVTCAAAPSLFYADWVERNSARLPAPRRLRASCWRFRRSHAASRTRGRTALSSRSARPTAIDALM